MNGPRGVERLRASAQDHRVAGFETQRAGIGRHIGPALIDDAEHADGRRHARDVQAVWPSPARELAADRIGKRRHIGDALGGRLDAFRIELQPVHQSGPEISRSSLHVLVICGQDLVLMGADGVCGCEKCFVFVSGCRFAQMRSRIARGAAERKHFGFER